MRNWMSTKVKYDKLQEDGSIKSCTEEYLVDALSFTEAEKRINQELGKYIRGEFKIGTISKSKIAEIHDFEKGKFWFASVLEFEMFDDKKFKEVKSQTKMLFSADDIESAIAMTKKIMSPSMANWKFISVTETKIQDVFEYVPDEKLNPAIFRNYERS